MSWKASKAQLVDPVFADKFITRSLAFQTVFILIMIFIQIFFATSSEALICSNLEHTVLIDIPYPSIAGMIEAKMTQELD